MQTHPCSSCYPVQTLILGCFDERERVVPIVLPSLRFAHPAPKQLHRVGAMTNSIDDIEPIAQSLAREADKVSTLDTPDMFGLAGQVPAHELLIPLDVIHPHVFAVGEVITCDGGIVVA